MRAHRLLFVCTGNICRSPMAHILAESEARRGDVAVDVRSASTLGLLDRPAHKKMIRVAGEIDLDLTQHRSTPLSVELIHWADVIAVMERHHLISVCDLVPDAADKVVSMGELIGIGEVADPVNAWTLGPFRTCRDQLRKATSILMLTLDQDGRPA